MTRIRAVTISVACLLAMAFSIFMVNINPAADQDAKVSEQLNTNTTEIATTTSTTVQPSTTTTVVQQVAATRRVAFHAPEVRAQSSAPSTSGDVFDRLAMCESGMHNDTSGPYFGYFQFLPGTWHSMGLSGMPYDYDYATQKDAAQRLVARSGWGQFPACGRKLGMR